MKIDDDMLISYALGTLTSDEEHAVAEHLQAHPEAAAQVRDYLEVMAAVALDVEPEPVPENAGQDLLARLQREGLLAEGITEAPHETEEPSIIQMPKRANNSWWLGLAVAAALAVVTWLGFLQPRYENWQLAQQLESTCAEAGTVCEPLVTADGDTLGTLARRPDNSLLVVLESPPPEGSVYQAWEIAGGQAIPLSISEDRVVDIDRQFAADSVFGLSLEPPGGSEQPTKVLATLQL